MHVGPAGGPGKGGRGWGSAPGPTSGAAAPLTSNAEAFLNFFPSPHGRTSAMSSENPAGWKGPEPARWRFPGAGNGPTATEYAPIPSTETSADARRAPRRLWRPGWGGQPAEATAASARGGMGKRPFSCAPPDPPVSWALRKDLNTRRESFVLPVTDGMVLVCVRPLTTGGKATQRHSLGLGAGIGLERGRRRLWTAWLDARTAGVQEWRRVRRIGSIRARGSLSDTVSDGSDG